MPPIACRPKPLTPSQAAEAVRQAMLINPANGAARRTLVRTPVGRRGVRVVLQSSSRASGRRAACGSPCSSSTIAPADLRQRILLHMNAWNKTANVQFVETRGTGTGAHHPAR